MNEMPLQPNFSKREMPKKRFWIYLATGIFGVIIFIAVILIFSSLAKTSHPSLSLWREIKPGQDSKEQIILKLGNPNKINAQEDREVLIYSSENEILPNMIFINSKTEKVESTIKHIDKKENLQFSDVAKIYGKPEKEMYNHYGFFSKTYIWAQKGIAVIGNKDLNQVFEVSYFAPISIEEYLQKYGQGLSEEIPENIF